MRSLDDSIKLIGTVNMQLLYVQLSKQLGSSRNLKITKIQVWTGQKSMIVRLRCTFLHHWRITPSGSWSTASSYYISIAEEGRYNEIINTDNRSLRIKKALRSSVRTTNLLRRRVFRRILSWCCKTVDIFIIKELWSDRQANTSPTFGRHLGTCEPFHQVARGESTSAIFVV